MAGDDIHTVNTAALSDLTSAETHRHAATAEMAVPMPLEVGDRYHTERVLGEGGMGKVLLCTDAVIGRASP